MNNATTQQDLSPQAQSFNAKFGDLAFSTFRAKYPKLQSNIVTFKVIDSDVDAGSAMGAFVLQRGQDVVYVPIILTNGAITSCEMVYSKSDDTLAPLVQGEVDRILSANSVGEPTVSDKAPMVESTKNLFRNMFRPPSRSNIVLASDAQAVEQLPNEAKKALSSYLESNQDLLGKVAEFYPVEALARKLVPVRTKVAETQEQALPELIKLAEVTSEVSKLLSTDQKTELLKTGYLVTTSPSAENATRALGTTKLADEATTKLQLVEKDDSNPMYGTAHLLQIEGAEIVPVKCAVVGNTILTEKGVVRLPYGYNGRVVLSEFKDGVWASDLIGLGMVIPEAMKGQEKTAADSEAICSSSNSARDWDPLMVFYPTKSGNFKTYQDREIPVSKRSYGISAGCSSDSPSIRRKDLINQNVDGDIYLKNVDSYDKRTRSFGFVKHLNHGFLNVSKDNVVFPRTALVTFRIEDSGRFIDSIGSLQRFLMNTSPKLRLIDNGAGLSLNDSATKKTANFKDVAEVAGYVAKTYALDKVATEKLLADREVVLFRKQAFVNPSTVTGPDQDETAGQSFGTTGFQPQPGQGTQPGDYNVDYQMLDAAADLGDEDMFDTGMLASLAENKDIKELLVDMVPSFSETVTHLGRSLLAFSINKDQMEEYYGREQYTGLLGNVRKVFQMLGNIVYDLKSYVNMN